MVTLAFVSGRSPLPRLVPIVAAALCQLVALGAAAQEPSAKAADLYTMATKALRAHDYGTAARLYEQAYALVRDATTLGAIGKCNYLQYQQSSNTKCACDAITQLNAYIEATKGASDPATVAFIKETQERLENLKPVVGDTQDTCAEVKPPPPPPTKVMVSSDTPGASFSIDADVVTASPAIVEVSPGEHNVKVSAKGYRDVLRRVTVDKGQIYATDITLAPLPGTLQIGANEQGAEVYVDGLKVGTTPFTGTGFAPGSHFVSIRQSGRKLWSSNLDLQPAGSASTTAQLEPTRQRQNSSYLFLGAGVALGAGIVTGLAAYSMDTSLNSGSSTTNQQRADYDTSLRTRNTFATTSTLAFIVAGAALIAGGSMYWFDTPPTPATHGNDNVSNREAVSWHLGLDGLHF